MPLDEVGTVVVPETTGLEVLAADVVMVFSSNSDVDAARGNPGRAAATAASSEARTAASSSVMIKRWALGLLLRCSGGRGRCAGWELQASAVGLQPGIVERLLQLGRVLAQHGERFGFSTVRCRVTWPF